MISYMDKRLYAFVISFVFSIIPPALFAETWTQSGMGGGGGIELPSISPHNPNHVYLSSDMSGVYKTENFGNDWSLLPFRMNGQEGVNDKGASSPIQYTSNPQIIYANQRETYPSQANDSDANASKLSPKLLITKNIYTPQSVCYF